LKIRTLIVDDEAPARARVRRMLADEDDIEIIGEAANGDDAIRAIGELRPQLLFLDVQMPAPDGLAVLRAVRDEWLPCTIFITAFAEHAVAAFELHALDYLLKPYARERFAKALERVRIQIATAKPAAKDDRVEALINDERTPRQPVERFLVRNNEHYVVVRAGDIESVEAAANYAVLHTREGNHILRRTLSTLETELDPNQFFRLNRSCIVKLAAIREIQTLTAGEFVVFLQSGAKFTLTRGLRDLQDKLRSTK
jgi:two-component system LytT family response regulator